MGLLGHGSVLCNELNNNTNNIHAVRGQYVLFSRTENKKDRGKSFAFCPVKPAKSPGWQTTNEWKMI